MKESLEDYENLMKTCDAQSRLKRFSPSLVLVAVSLLFTAACETTPSGPPVPISSGSERPAPGTVPVDVTETEDPEETAETAQTSETDTSDGYVPPHMAGRDIKRAAVLLPFSHPRATVRAEAEGILAGIELAIFNRGEESFVIFPKDTAGVTSTATARAQEALDEGADIIIGPLFSANVKAVRTLARDQDVPVIAFSTLMDAAGQGAYLISRSPEEQVSRIVDYAARKGATRFAFLGPRSSLGRRAEATLRQEAARTGGQVLSSAFYEPSNDAPVDAAKQIASAIEAEGDFAPGSVAILIPEGGIKLRAVAPLLPYYGVDIRNVQLLGTEQWNDPTIWREPTLVNGVFAAADPLNAEQFNAEFRRIYNNRDPSSLSSIGYDAGALASALAAQDRLDLNGVTDRDGFQGVNGLFRFRADGTSQRALSVLQITASEGAVLVEAGPSDFDGPQG
jgi:ABC-type branched-subunit amino acid transport system substrate-binding protein